MIQLTKDQEIWEAMDELKAIARQLLSREENARSLQPTGLVQTALRRQNPKAWAAGHFEEIHWENRNQMMGFMHHAMKNALIDYARAQNRVRKLSTVQVEKLDYENFRRQTEDAPELLTHVMDALETVRDSHPLWVQAFEYWTLEQLAQHEIAELMEVHEKTVYLWIQRVRMLVLQELKKDAED